MSLSAVVIGSGWAGEGHTLALRAAGVEIAALCGRSAEPSHALAKRLEIPEVRLNWRSALSEFQPDIVTIATPGAPHREMAEAAAREGCHVFCDKPLAVNSAEAHAMLSAVRRANVKHAYGPASCLAAPIAYARERVADGMIGMLTSIEVNTYLGLSQPLAHSWFHQLSQGGGMLNQIFTHTLAQVLRITDGTPKQVTGEARCYVTRAPIGPPIHDFREWFAGAPDVDKNDADRWRSADADTDYAVMLRLSLPKGGEVTARFAGSLTTASQDGEHLALYGNKGTLVVTGRPRKEMHHYDLASDTWEQLIIPTSGQGPAQAGQSSEQRNWNALIRQFAADIRGESHSFYPTFEDGWVAAEIIDMVRAGRAWEMVPVNDVREISPLGA